MPSPEADHILIEVSADDVATDEQLRAHESMVRVLQADGLDVHLVPFRRRTLEPAVLMSVAASALTAIIAGVCAIAAARGNQKIVVETEKGGKVEVPANFTRHQIEELLLLTKDLSTVKRIRSGKSTDSSKRFHCEN